MICNKWLNVFINKACTKTSKVLQVTHVQNSKIARLYIMFAQHDKSRLQIQPNVAKKHETSNYQSHFFQHKSAFFFEDVITRFTAKGIWGRCLSTLFFLFGSTQTLTDPGVEGACQHELFTLFLTHLTKLILFK